MVGPDRRPRKPVEDIRGIIKPNITVASPREVEGKQRPTAHLLECRVGCFLRRQADAPAGERPRASSNPARAVLLPPPPSRRLGRRAPPARNPARAALLPPPPGRRPGRRAPPRGRQSGAGRPTPAPCCARRPAGERPPRACSAWLLPRVCACACARTGEAENEWNEWLAVD